MPSKPVDQLRDLVGETRPTVTGFDVERGKVAEFARAVRDPADVYLDEEAAVDAGYETIPAPPTFVRTAYFPRYRPDETGQGLGFHEDLGFDQPRTVHGEQRYEYERPLYVGDSLTGRTTLEDVYERDGGRGGTLTFALLRTDFEDAGGEHVLADWNTRIETGRAIAGDDE